MRQTISAQAVRRMQMSKFYTLNLIKLFFKIRDAKLIQCQGFTLLAI